jgi:hypothetical protein
VFLVGGRGGPEHVPTPTNPPPPLPPPPTAAAQIDEKYGSRAAKMYRAHLAKAAGAATGGGGKGGDGHSDEEADGWGTGGGGGARREAGSAGASASVAPRASPPALGRGISDSSVSSAGPLSSEFLDRSVAKAVSAAFAAEQAESAAQRPVAVREHEAPPTAAEAYAMHTHAGHSHAASATVGGGTAAGGVSAPSAPAAIGVLDVSAITGDGASPSGEGTSTGAGAVKKPIVIGTGAARPGGLGAKKLGATKLGATKLGSTPSSGGSGAAASGGGGGKLSVAGFGDDEFAAGTVEVAAAPAPAPVVAAPTPAAASADATRPKLAAAKPSGVDGLSDEYSRFAGAKAISSSQMYTRPEEDEAVRDASARLAAMGSVKAISSDMLFGGGGGGGGARGRGESGHSEGSGGRWASRAGSEGVSDFVEKLGAAVGDDLRKVGNVVADKAGRLREGMSAFMDAMRR